MDKQTFYTTIENQIRNDDSMGLLYDHFTDYNAALAKFYTICAAAAVSGIQYHSAHLLQDDGRMVKQEIFDRRPYVEPEPEPTPEEPVEPEEPESGEEGEGGEDETTPEVEPEEEEPEAEG